MAFSNRLWLIEPKAKQHPHTRTRHGHRRQPLHNAFPGTLEQRVVDIVDGLVRTSDSDRNPQGSNTFLQAGVRPDSPLVCSSIGEHKERFVVVPISRADCSSSPDVTVGGDGVHRQVTLGMGEGRGVGVQTNRPVVQSISLSVMGSVLPAARAMSSPVAVRYRWVWAASEFPSQAAIGGSTGSGHRRGRRPRRLREAPRVVSGADFAGSPDIAPC